MNRIKVKKEIKGLKVGDILFYDETKGVFIFNKVDRDVSENTTSTKSLYISVDKWVVDNSLDYFTYIDEEGNEVDSKIIEYSDTHPEQQKDKGVDNSKQVIYWRIRNPFERYLLWI